VIKAIELGTIFSVAFCAVLLELLQMKYLSVLLNSTSGYLIITLALLMFSLSAGVLSFIERAIPKAVIFLTRFFEWFFLLSCILSLVGLRHLTYIRGVQQISKDFWFSSAVLVLTIAPYFFAGWVIVVAVRSWHKRSEFNIAYLIDLLGLLSSALLPHFFIRDLGPEKLMAVSLLLPAIVFSVKISSSQKFSRILSLCLLGLNACIIFYILNFTKVAEPLNPVLKKYKPEINDSQLELSLWDPIARIDVVDFGKSAAGEPESKIKYLFFDGGTIGTNIYSFDGDYETLKREYWKNPTRYFLRRATPAAHLLKENTSANVFIAGAGAGQEVKAALMYGAGSVIANELNESVNELNAGKYSAYNGGIFLDKRVRVIGGDGRMALSRLHEKFDIIQIFSAYLSANMALGLSPFAVSYLFTEESVAEYIDHLNPDGILQLNQYDYKKLLAIFSAVWKKRGDKDDLRNHLYVIESGDSADILPTLLFKKSPFKKEDEMKLQWLFHDSLSTDESYRFTESPFKPTEPESFFSETADHSKFHRVKDSWPFFVYSGQSYFNDYGLNKLSFWLAMSILMVLALAAFRISIRSANPKLTSSQVILFFGSGAVFIMFQYAVSAAIIRYLDSIDLAYPLTIAGFAVVGSGYCLFAKKVRGFLSGKKTVRIIAAGILALFIIWALTGLFNFEAENFMNPDELSRMLQFLSVIGFIASTALLASFSFPVAMQVSVSNETFVAPWLLNGMGLLAGSLLAQPLALFMGIKGLWLLSAVIATLLFFLISKDLE
jgi:hypothetical protein